MDHQVEIEWYKVARYPFFIGHAGTNCCGVSLDGFWQMVERTLQAWTANETRKRAGHQLDLPGM
jgi:hypothetical protein